MSVFVDTTAVYALLDRADLHHVAAERSWRALVGAGTALVTTSYVVVEGSALLQSRLGLAAVRDLYESLLPLLSVHWVSAEEHLSAMAAHLLAARRRLSLVDCVSFEVMRRLGLREAFSFDRHFRDQGFALRR